MAQTQLDKFKIALGITGELKDSELSLILEDAENDVIVWTNRKTLPVQLQSVVRQIAVIRYNMQGIEGQSSHSEGGVSRSFNELPASVQNTLVQFRLLKAARHATKTT